MKHFLLFIITLFINYLAKSQTPFCGNDLLPVDPAAQVLHEQLEQQAYEYFSNFQGLHHNPTDASQAVLTIPVVVHIIHDNGPENISDAQVQQAIAWLNAAYTNTGYFDQGSGTNVGIQFCLAQRTINGLATSGITRNQSSLTSMTIETQDAALKNLNRWEPKQYLNIWLVRAICSNSAGCAVAGYAYLPVYHGTQLDGLVIESQFFGAVQSQTSLAAHEIGHYLGLYHTFEGGCTNNNCLLNGDRVCDTPPDQSTAAVPCGQSVNTCSTDTQSGFTSDQPDMTSNYLDYGDINCLHDFTPGQSERMNFYLNGVRHSLLDSKGCLPPCPTPMVSAFTASATTINPGQTVNFTNTSQNAQTYQWSINGTPFSTVTNATYSFNAPDTYTVTLVAQPNNDLCDAATSQVVIEVVCTSPVISAFTPSATTINAGQSINFTNNSQNAQTYQWSINGTPFSTSTNAAHTFSTPGTYTVTLLAQSDAAFCNTASSEVVIQVICNVVADFTVSNQNPAENDTIILTNTSQNATVFSWTINGVEQADTLTTLTFTEAGIYNIQLTASNSFCQNSLQQQIVVQDSCVNKTFQYALKGDSVYQYWRGLQIASLLDSSILLVTLALQNSNELHTVITKFSKDGIQIWSREVLDSIFSTTQFTTGNIVLCATSDGGFILGLSDVNAVTYVAKLTAAGQITWVRALPGSLYININDLIVNANQEILVLGDSQFGNSAASFFAKLGPSGNVIWAKRPGFSASECRKIAFLPDGGLISVGNQNNSFGQVVRLNAQGNVIWRKKILLEGGGHISDVAVKAESVFITGGAASSDILLLKMNLDGQILWSKSYTNPEFLVNIEEMMWAKDGLILSGTSIQPGSDVGGFLVRFDTMGTMQWNHRYQHGFGSVFYNVAANAEGYLVAGSFLSDLDQSAAWILQTDDLGLAGTCLPESLPFIVAASPAGQEDQTWSALSAINMIPASFSLQNFPIIPTLLCEKACPKTPEICDNNIDDDGDGLFDCLDPDCPCLENACQPERNNNWYFGKRAGLDFSTDPPTIKVDGQSNNLNVAATISDNRGNLLFYTDGHRIFNRFHQVMPQGTNPEPLTNEAEINCMIIPYPGNSALYYVFISDQQATFQFTLVDMRLDNGKGDVVPTAHFSAMQAPFPKVYGMAATRSCTFDGYWLAVHEITGQRLLAYRIDQSGLHPSPVISPTGDLLILPTAQMKFSPDGKRLIRVTYGGSLILYNFDLDFTLSGQFTTPIPLQIVSGVQQALGVEFSPTGRYIYVSGYKQAAPKSFVYQFDLEAGYVTDVQNSAVEIANEEDIAVFAKLQATSNGKIYVANTSTGKTIDVINQPDRPGLNSEYQKAAIVLPATSDYNFGFSNCISSDFHQLDIHFSFDAPDSICNLSSPTTYYINNLSCDVDSIHWSLAGLPGNIVPNYQYAAVTYTGPGQGQLIVTAFTSCGQASDTLPVTVHAGFTQPLNLGPDRVVCDNGVFTFHAGSGFYRYRWQDGSTDSILTTLLPGKYWVDVYDVCNNKLTDTVTVSIAPASVLSLGPDIAQCVGLPMTFQRPDIFAKWQWLPNVFLSCDTCASVTVDPNTTTSWTVIAQTAEGCLSLDTLHWKIIDTLFVSQEITICENQTIDLYGVTVPADTTVQFLRPNIGLGCDTLLTIHTLGVEAPTATVQAQVCPDQFFDFHGTLLPADTTAIFHLPAAGCDSVVTVEVTAFPPVTASLPADTSLSIGASLTLHGMASGTGQLSFNWEPNIALSCNDCLQPEANPLDTITYVLLVTDQNGCSARDSITLRINSDCQIFIPNAFTPNGDDINDWFYPATLPCVRTVRLWRVVNRWGEVVFERRNFEPNQENLGWNGQGQPSEVFVWMAELEYFDGRIEPRKGEVMLLR